MPFGPTHTLILWLAKSAVRSFYYDCVTLDEHNVPKDGPLLAAASHANMTVDPAVLSSAFPHGRLLHYWSKDSLFKNPIAKAILLDAGNLPVARTGKKDNQALYASTFDVFKLGECVAVFPEGTSLHEPGLLPLKDGVCWVALEYAKNLRQNGRSTSDGHQGQYKDVTIAVAGITYTKKQRYRTSVIMQMAPSLTVTDYIDEFLNGDAKSAVKRMTKELENRLRSVTINAKDWKSYNAAQMARELLFEDVHAIPRKQYRRLLQSLIDFFEDASEDQERDRLLETLTNLYSALQTAHLSNPSLKAYELPKDLDPQREVALPTRIEALMPLVKATLMCLVHLPFFILPLTLHWPTYYLGKWSQTKFNALEEECWAQNKIVLGMIALLIIYVGCFFALWRLAVPSAVGALISFAIVWALAQAHTSLIDSNYNHSKRLLASWRVLIGLWTNDEAVHSALRLRTEASYMLQEYSRKQRDSELVGVFRDAGFESIGNKKIN